MTRSEPLLVLLCAVAYCATAAVVGIAPANTTAAGGGTVPAARSRSWPLACIDTTAGVSARTKACQVPARAPQPPDFVARWGRFACFAGATVPCFRAVHDGFLGADAVRDARRALELGPNMYRDGLGYTIGSDEVGAVPADAAATVTGLAEAVARTFAERHGVHGLRMSQANFVTSELPFHFDYHYSAASNFVYSSLLYLDTQLDGGATIFVDALQPGSSDSIHSFSAADGLRVQPSPGRLALFSSGAENVHAGLPVSTAPSPDPAAAPRRVLAMFFDCEKISIKVEL